VVDSGESCDFTLDRPESSVFGGLISLKSAAYDQALMEIGSTGFLADA
jgi:hypothetical protein